MRDRIGIGSALRGMVPAVALVAALPALPAAATVAAPVPCPDGRGNEAALVRAFKAGGTITLAEECTYTVTKRHGSGSALPAVTKDLIIEGNRSTIAWGGTEQVRTLIELAGRPRVKLVLKDVRLRAGKGMSTLRVRRNTSASISSSGGMGPRVSKQLDSEQLDSTKVDGERAVEDTSAAEPVPPSGGPVPTTPEPGTPAGTSPSTSADSSAEPGTAPAPAVEDGYDVGHLIEADHYVDRWLPALLNGPLSGLLGLAPASRDGGRNGAHRAPVIWMR
ncbi:hypothetical protein [Actinomadura sp. 9N407]|uniref:hypothetical protein n=1 Tax=Actinomadura sp. 9N407 TaxID=3375154 RepID=UPI0037BB9246